MKNVAQKVPTHAVIPLGEADNNENTKLFCYLDILGTGSLSNDLINVLS